MDQPVLWAQITEQTDAAPVVRIVSGTYRGPSQQPGKIKLKIDGNRFPLNVPQIHTAANAIAANQILAAEVSKAIHAHDTAARRLTAAFEALQAEASVFWPSEKNPAFVKHSDAIEHTVINSLATFKANLAAETFRNSMQSSLIAAHERAASKQASRLQQIRASKKR